MRRMCLATAVTVLIAASLVVGWAAELTVNGGALQVFTFPVDLAPVAATVDIDPDSLNPESQGKFVMAYVELPEGYDVADIDVSTVTLEIEGAYGGVAAAPSPTAVGDEDGDGIPDRMVKFSREAVVALLDGRTGDITFRVRGEVSGSPFEGTDTIRVLDSEGGVEDSEPALPEEGSGEAAAPPGPPPPTPSMPTMEYEVQPGDTLVDIAARFGTTVEVLVRLNRLQNANLIPYGSVLNVPYVGEDAGGEGNESDPSEEVAVPDTAPMPTPTAPSPTPVQTATPAPTPSPTPLPTASPTPFATPAPAPGGIYVSVTCQGQPVAGAQVRVSHQSPGEPVVWSGGTGDDGELSTGLVLNAGSYLVDIVNQGASYDSVIAAVPAGGYAPVYAQCTALWGTGYRDW